MVQLLFRAGASSRTLALQVDPSADVLRLKHELAQLAQGMVGAPQDMVLVHEGRVLRDDASLQAYPGLLAPLSRHQQTAQQQYQQQDQQQQEDGACSASAGPAVVHVVTRLRGGGGDGGSTGAESRSCYLEMYANKKPDKVNPTESLLAKWTRCQLSGADLSPPCVVDELGCLYNKDALLSALLEKSMPAHLAYITGLRSVTELKLTRKAGGSGAGGTAGGSGGAKAAVKGLHNPGNEADFCCPVTDLEFNGRFKFLVHRPTGHVVAEKAWKELPQVVEELVGSKPSQDDFIQVNPPAEQLEPLKVKLAAKLAAEREKKAKKLAAKHQQAIAATADKTNGAASVEAGGKREASPGATDADASARPLALGPGQKREVSPALPAAAAAAVVTGAMLPPSKKAKVAPALSAMPRNSDTSIYASLFTSSLPEGAEKETYLCRNTSARGVHLT